MKKILLLSYIKKIFAIGSKLYNPTHLKPILQGMSDVPRDSGRNIQSGLFHPSNELELVQKTFEVTMRVFHLYCIVLIF